jgi:deoxycytidylate deaminase
MALTQAASKDDYTIDDFYTEEIVIGICGPIGVDLPAIATRIADNLRAYSYEAKYIKLSKIIEDCVGEITGSPLERKERLIDSGNHLRQEHERGSFLAEKAIELILKDRLAHFPDQKFTSRRKCFIIDSIKNVAEAKKFREVYGESFYLIGVFSSHDRKIANLTKGNTSLNAAANKLIENDYNQKGSYGQQVSKVFQTADYFFRIEGQEEYDAKVQRLLSLILGAEIITPSTSETAMFAAASAARNSACLSRQVGAAIIDNDGNVISTGWNDVPKFTGGTYRHGPNDHRCFNNGRYCRNDQEKYILINDIVNDLIKNGAIEDSRKEITYNVISKSRVSDLIEFSRAVHAEMLAILNAAKSGTGLLNNSVLYCTTYPCHSCARHIVASGIKEVYFIEPYAKSKAISLHNDSITEHENEVNKLKILAYEGVAPTRYLDFSLLKMREKYFGKLSTTSQRST